MHVHAPLVFLLLHLHLQHLLAPATADDASTGSCACDGAVCTCCVDLNLTYVDLGGPGCVRMTYLSQAEGLSVDVSYGGRVLHSRRVAAGPDQEPACVALLTDLAQICARFAETEPHNDGLRSCVSLEPKLLQTVTSRFPLGCFTMGPRGMRLENSSYVGLLSAGIGQANATQAEDLNEEELLAAVSGTAEQGLAFLGNLFQFTFGESNSNNKSEAESSSQPSEATAQRSLGNLSRP